MQTMIVEPGTGATPTAVPALQRFFPPLLVFVDGGGASGEMNVTTPLVPSPPCWAKAGEAGMAARLSAVMPTAIALRVRRMGIPSLPGDERGPASASRGRAGIRTLVLRPDQ